ncbi:girdin [Lates japonicus]|uniref:Girdin n=1 Tax=Lates japonicus TaxID=270547 RepID=A0AAD3N702_LATJO|nr:girdin [Lates japonicus]
MESEVFTPLLEQFMLTPLVCWVKTVGQLAVTDGTKLSEYIELVDGIYLNEIMLEISSVLCLLLLGSILLLSLPTLMFDLPPPPFFPILVFPSSSSFGLLLDSQGGIAQNSV